jgi:hypothetical protein
MKRKVAIRLFLTKFLRGSFRPPRDKSDPFCGHVLRGFRVSDLLEGFHLYGDKRFEYYKPSKKEAMAYTKYLEDEGLIRSSGIDGDENLYEITQGENDKYGIHGFLLECEQTIQIIIDMITSRWMDSQPKKSEVSWYKQVFGDRKTLEVIKNLDQTREKYYSELIETHRAHHKAVGNAIPSDSVIRTNIKRNNMKRVQWCDDYLKHAKPRMQNYDSVRTRYSTVYKYMIEIAYPPFLDKDRYRMSKKH